VRVLTSVIALLSISQLLCAQRPTAEAAIAAARQGGVVIACRHAKTVSWEEDEATLKYDDPSTQRRLSPEGERQARSIGDAWRQLGIRASDIISSPMDRARRSAELLAGTPKLDSAWHTRGSNYAGAKHDTRLAALTTPIMRGTRLIVSHLGTMGSMFPDGQLSLDEGDCVVVRPRGAAFDVVGTVPWQRWLDAAKSPD
jgi:phosphohistidine phosphatase SixA